jgi:hypothetical protein
MSTIRFNEQTEPATPPAGKATLFVDSTDKEVAVKKDDGTVQKFLSSIAILEGEFAKDDTLQSTTSDVYAAFLTLNTAALAGGNYKIDWSFLWRYSTTVRDFWARVVIDGVQVWEMSQEPKDVSTNIRHPAAGFDVVNLAAGTHTIEIQYRASLSGDTAQVETARIALSRFS